MNEATAARPHTRNPLLQTRHRAPHPLWLRARVEIVHFWDSSSHLASLLIVRRVVFGGERSHSPRHNTGVVPPSLASLGNLRPLFIMSSLSTSQCSGEVPSEFFSHQAALRKGHCLVKCLRSGMNAVREASLLLLHPCTLTNKFNELEACPHS